MRNPAHLGDGLFDLRLGRAVEDHADDRAAGTSQRRKAKGGVIDRAKRGAGHQNDRSLPAREEIKVIALTIEGDHHPARALDHHWPG